MSKSRVIVVGGGLAGLRAAVACADAGASVRLLEARSRLGGATWSAERGEIEVDNGQHVFMRCCTAYLDWLDRLGVRDLVHLQPKLAVPVLSPASPPAWIRRNALPRPLHLAGSVLRYGPLPLSKRIRAAMTARRFERLDPDDPALDELSLGDWLRDHGESDLAIDRFWDLLIRPTLNCPAREASLALSARVLRTGFLDRADGSDIGWSRVPLSQLHAAPAADALTRAGAIVECKTAVRRILPSEDGKPAQVHVSGAVLEAHAVIVAMPPRDAARVLQGVGGIDSERAKILGRSPIVNLHILFDRTVLPHSFAAGVGTPIQWIFDRTASSGLTRGQYLTIVLSAGSDYEGRSSQSLRAEFEPALRALLPAARDARIEDFFVMCDREATFEQRPGMRRYRPLPGRIAPSLFIAGAWTDTGWPATMESAVRSGLSSADAALSSLRPPLELRSSS